MLFLHSKVLFWIVVVVGGGVSGECGNKTTSALSWGWGSAGAELGNNACPYIFLATHTHSLMLNVLVKIRTKILIKFGSNYVDKI